MKRLWERFGLGGESPVIRSLLTLNVVLYLITVLFSADFVTALLDGPNALTLVHFGATNSYQWADAKTAILTTFDQPWRLLTSTFLHGSGLHILLNMYALWNLGRTVEVVFGARRTLYIYLVSGVLGSIASVELQTRPLVGVGASGAIMGLLGATIYFALTLRNQGRRINWGQLLTPVVMTLAYGLMLEGVDNWAHIGGLLGGGAAGFLAGVPSERQSWKPIVAGALGALLLAILVGLVPLIPWLYKPV
ncbi:MAG TPA: rhomboid family intramembrane serine protease [Symbiobacteriaceae bacterium]|nr:rhomboid family intramembrane serine protease [Symbiobacteriaceae bacterium]